MLRKRTIRVSFLSLFKLSKQEKYQVIFFVKLVKTIATNLSTQSRTSLTDARLAKNIATGFPEGKNIDQAYVILLNLDKNKEVLVSNDWGKMEENLKNFIGSRSLLNMTLSLHHHD